MKPRKVMWKPKHCAQYEIGYILDQRKGYFSISDSEYGNADKYWAKEDIDIEYLD